MSLNLKKIITDFRKYHYFIMNKGKISLLSSDNSNTTAKNNAFDKLKKTGLDKIYLYRIKLSKSSNYESVFTDATKIGPLYFEINEYIYNKKKIQPTNEKSKVNVFIKQKYLINGIKMKDIASNVKKYMQNKLNTIPTKLNYL